MRYRRKMRNKRSRKVFTKTASRSHRKNQRNVFRGGIRL